MEKIMIYADGACRGNQFNENIGAYGIVLIYNNHIKTLNGSYKNTTNNKMELIAVIEALKALKKFNIPVEIYTDSQYVVSTINEGWNKRANIELWEQLDNLILKFKNISFYKVKGHNGNKYNEMADKLCNDAMDVIGV